MSLSFRSSPAARSPTPTNQSIQCPGRQLRPSRFAVPALRAAKGRAEGTPDDDDSATPPPPPPPLRPQRLIITPSRRAALLATGCAACHQLLLLATYGPAANAATSGPFERRRQAGLPRSSGIAFSYDRQAADGPAHWPGACNDAGSREQSPIDVAEGVLTTPASSSCRPARLDFSAYKGLQRGVVVRNVGFGAEVRFPPGNFLRVVLPPPADDADAKNKKNDQQQQQTTTSEPSVRRLELLQYHFHEPGEHAVSGRRGAMEAHLVHRDPSLANRPGAGLAVVALLLDAADGPAGGKGLADGSNPPPPPGQQGSAADALRALLETVPEEPNSQREVAYAVDPSWLVRDAGALGGVGGSASPSFFTYRGSLTTPPCGEGVEWFVLASRAAVVPAAQVAAFRSFARSLPGGVASGGNARPLQPLNGRATSAAVEAAVQSGELHRIAAILDAAELEAPHPLPAAWPTALHVLAHALNGDLPDARHAHRRLAPDTASAGAGPLADQAAALRVLRRLWPGEGGTAATASSTAAEAAPETVFAALEGHAWPAGPTAAVAAALAAKLRERAWTEVARAYTRLPLREAALLLGYGADEAAAAQAARAAGWRVGEGGGGAGAAAAGGGAVVEPKAPEAAEPQLDPSSLRRLTEYLAHLEGDGFGGLLAGGGGGGGGAGGGPAAGANGVEAAAGG